MSLKYIIKQNPEGQIIYWGEDDFPEILEEHGFKIGKIQEADETHVIMELIPDKWALELVREFPWVK